MDAQQPALPWGAAPAAAHPARPEQEDMEAGEPVEVDLLARLALSAAARIEVKWELENDGEDGEEPAVTVKWWGASIAGKVEGEQDGEGRQCYLLRYDAHDGFDEETCKVTFLTEHILYDVAEDQELLWRREGEEWDAEPEGSGDEGEEGGSVQLIDVVAAIRQAERRRGRTVEEECLDLVKGLPPDQQRFMISGFSDYAETLSSGIKELCQQKGAGYVVTAEDVRALTQKAMQKYKDNLASFLP